MRRLILPVWIFFLLSLNHVSAQDSPSEVSQNSSSKHREFTWITGDRSTWEILRSCLITLLACTWTVLHLNIPAPEEHEWALIKRKFKWMAITVISPEITCSMALRQWVESRTTLKEMKQLGLDWSRVHGFYAGMGGYVLNHRGMQIPLVVPEIISLLKITSKDGERPFSLPPLTREDIEDRSKAGDIGKLFAGVQIGWLILQCIARAGYHLPISQLEISTVAFGVCTIIAYGFWWNKPMDIKMTTPVFYDGELPPTINTESKGWNDRKERRRVKMTTRMITRGSQKSMFFNLVLPLFSISTLFGSIHLIAWNFDFVDPSDRLIWRSCSLIASLMPIPIACSLQIASIWDPAARSDSRQGKSAPELAALVVCCYFLSIIAYMCARLLLMFQVFYCLRLLPVGTFRSVPWIQYIPHV